MLCCAISPLICTRGIGSHLGDPGERRQPARWRVCWNECSCRVQLGQCCPRKWIGAVAQAVMPGRRGESGRLVLGRSGVVLASSGAELAPRGRRGAGVCPKNQQHVARWARTLAVMHHHEGEFLAPKTEPTGMHKNSWKTKANTMPMSGWYRVQ
jgi:hypothetical protein